MEFGGGREGVAQSGLACLAQARQNRPGKGELDLTDIRMLGRGHPALTLSSIPQECRDIEVVLVDGRQSLMTMFRLTR